MRVSVVVPDEHLADVIANLSDRRGHIDLQEPRDGMQIVLARVPLSEMFGYAVDLRERTQGRGSFTLAFDRYQPRRPADGEGDSFEGAPRRPHPAPEQSHVALPEPGDPEPGS